MPMLEGTEKSGGVPAATVRRFVRASDAAVTELLKVSYRPDAAQRLRARLPNREPGNNPYTDILQHGRSEYGEPVDGVVKSMAFIPGFDSAATEVTKILWDSLPLGQTRGRDALLRTALAQLEAVRWRLVARSEGAGLGY